MRYSDIEFPPYAHFPGITPHPNKEGGHREGKDDPKAMPLNMQNPKSNNDYIYAIDLFNYGYYWESHVYWEAIWHAHGRKGNEADFLKGLIKIAAAGVKWRMGQDHNVLAHLKRAKELLSPIKTESFYGVNLNYIIKEIGSLIETNKFDKVEVKEQIVFSFKILLN